MLLLIILVTIFFSGLHFEQALFVPNQSQYNKLGSLASPPSEREQIDLSWQLSLQKVWENLPHGNKGCSKLHCEIVFSCQHVFSY
jgi:folylpolyglutamate synthase